LKSHIAEEKGGKPWERVVSVLRKRRKGGEKHLALLMP